MGRIGILVVLFSLLLAAGCASTQTILYPNEKELRVDGGARREFHSTLYYPKGIALHYPGYVIGMQKTTQEIAQSSNLPKDHQLLKPEVPYFKNEKDAGSKLSSLGIMERLKTEKSLFVAHVTRYSFYQLESPNQIGRLYPYIDQELLYNAFLSPDLAGNENRDLTRAVAWKMSPNALPWGGAEGLDPKGFYSNGKLVFDSLARSVQQELKLNNYTQVIVLVMGWNTTQNEAIRNYNDIIGNIFSAASEEQPALSPGQSARQAPFRPLVIGVSWPSYWADNWYNFFSYPDMAHDADELGISWLNLLVNETLPKAIGQSQSKAPLVVIGHSFGARAVTRATFSSPALASQDGQAVQSKAALVVALEGAFSINRFSSTEDGLEGGPYRDFAALKQPTQIVLTASKFDTAAGGPIFWYDPAGSIKSYQLACGAGAEWRKDVFQCMTLHDNSELKNAGSTAGFRICRHDDGSQCSGPGEPLGATGGKVLYLDASDGVTRYNTLDTGGNAHNDIYRLPMGRLLWTLIKTYAPGNGP